MSSVLVGVAFDRSGRYGGALVLLSQVFLVRDSAVDT